MKTKLTFIALVIMTMVLNACLSGESKDSAKLEAVDSKTEKVVIGYIPTWVDMRETIDNTDLDILTHINLSFLNPDASGQFLIDGEPFCSDGSTSDIKYVVEKAHKNGVRVLVSVAGGILPECSGDWELLLKEPNRTTVVNNLKFLVDYYDLDGIDIDIEGHLLNTISEAGDYTPFIKELRDVLNPIGKLVTCATASYVGGRVPQSSFPYFDYINIMAYDNNWNTSEHHSTYDDAVRDMKLWLDLGCPAEKLVLGVPFYAHVGTVGSGHATYKEIVNQYPEAAQVDRNEDYRYNGIPTIQAKTEYAMEHGAGIMIWEISQDGEGSASLLKAIGEKL